MVNIPSNKDTVREMHKLARIYASLGLNYQAHDLQVMASYINETDFVIENGDESISKHDDNDDAFLKMLTELSKRHAKHP